MLNILVFLEFNCHVKLKCVKSLRPLTIINE